jgi:hypothetical protein
MELLESPWCQLISIGDEEEAIPIVGEKFTIGRKRGEFVRDCDVH